MKQIDFKELKIKNEQAITSELKKILKSTYCQQILDILVQNQFINLIISQQSVWKVDWSIFSIIKPVIFKLDFLFSKLEFKLLINQVQKNINLEKLLTDLKLSTILWGIVAKGKFSIEPFTFEDLGLVFLQKQGVQNCYKDFIYQILYKDKFLYKKFLQPNQYPLFLGIIPLLNKLSINQIRKEDFIVDFKKKYINQLLKIMFGFSSSEDENKKETEQGLQQQDQNQTDVYNYDDIYGTLLQEREKQVQQQKINKIKRNSIIDKINRKHNEKELFKQKLKQQLLLKQNKKLDLNEQIYITDNFKEQIIQQKQQLIDQQSKEIFKGQENQQENFYLNLVTKKEELLDESEQKKMYNIIYNLVLEKVFKGNALQIAYQNIFLKIPDMLQENQCQKIWEQYEQDIKQQSSQENDQQELEKYIKKIYLAIKWEELHIQLLKKVNEQLQGTLSELNISAKQQVQYIKKCCQQIFEFIFQEQLRYYVDLFMNGIKEQVEKEKQFKQQEERKKKILKAKQKYTKRHNNNQFNKCRELLKDQ